MSLDSFPQKKHRGRQLIENSSEGDQPLLSAGFLFSDQSNQTLEESLTRRLLFCCLLAETTSLIKKMNKSGARNGPWSDPIAFENIYDQIQVRSNRLWSDPTALEVASDQTKVRSKRLWSDPIALEVASDQTHVCSNPPMIRLFQTKWPLIRPSPDHGPDFSDQNDLWIEYPQTIDQTLVRSNFRPDPVISVWEHTGVRSTGSDHKQIWVWASTWEGLPKLMVHSQDLQENLSLLAAVPGDRIFMQMLEWNLLKTIKFSRINWQRPNMASTKKNYLHSSIQKNYFFKHLYRHITTSKGRETFFLLGCVICSNSSSLWPLLSFWPAAAHYHISGHYLCA